MPSVKLGHDTLSVLGALRGRLGTGHSYDALINELVKRQVDGVTGAVVAGDRLQRIEEIVTKILIHIEDSNHASAPKKFIVE
jgi:hypothetical protein